MSGHGDGVRFGHLLSDGPWDWRDAKAGEWMGMGRGMMGGA
jgi:hypothetical protein